MDFVKPGRNTYCVKTPPGFEAGRMKPNFYVHKFLSDQRLEDIPPCHITKEKPKADVKR